MSRVRAAWHAIGAMVVLTWHAFKVIIHGDFSAYPQDAFQAKKTPALPTRSEDPDGERYAQGEITFAELQKRTERRLRYDPETRLQLDEPGIIELLNTEKDPYGALKAKLRDATQQYQRSNDK